MLIGVEAHFDAAHRLSKHAGECSNLHGHRYLVCAELSGEVNDQGMVMDFSVFKDRLNSCTQMFDHAVILNSSDPLVDCLQPMGIAIRVLDYDPTAECLAKTIWSMMLEKSVNKLYGFDVCAGMELAIRVYETPTAFAEYRACIR